MVRVRRVEGEGGGEENRGVGRGGWGSDVKCRDER
jgi:hypothetical protein